MRDGIHQSPFNALPGIVWLMTLPVIATEMIFGLGQLGLLGGGQGDAFRLNAIELTAYSPAMVERMWSIGAVDWQFLYRLLSYPFVHWSLTQAIFVAVFTLALGNMVSTQFRPVALLCLYFGSAIGGALIYTIVSSGIQGPPQLLIGGYPAVYGLVGAFTFLLWTRLAAENANRMRAFTLIGALLTFQLVFGLIFGSAGLAWVAEIAGFFCGFALSFLLVDGGVNRALARLRSR